MTTKAQREVGGAVREPAFGQAPTGNRRWWTSERIRAGLTDYVALHPRGQLPCSDSAYAARKKGNPSWPPASRVLEEFGSMARAWLAVGASRMRISMKNVDWTVDEDDFLLENAGRLSLRQIGDRLGRSYPATRARLSKTHGKRARDVQCYLSAQQVARRYTASLSRVMRLIESGALPATKRLGNWRIDLRDAEKLRAELTAPRRTHKTWPVDIGDYSQRYGLRRRRRPDGTFERYEATG